MSQDFLLDQKKTTILVALFLVLLFLVFVAGYLSGMLVGLPEPDQVPVEPVARVEPKKAAPVVTAMPVPRAVDEEESEAPEDEPEAVEDGGQPEPVADIPPEKLYSVQVGAFKTRARADEEVELLSAKGYRPYVYYGANSRGAMWYTVRIGDFDDVDEAIAAAREFMALEDASVVLTHFESLMMVRDEQGKRIEVTLTTLQASDPSEAEPEAVEPEPEAVEVEPEAVEVEPEAVEVEPEAVEVEPDSDAAVPEPDEEVPGLLAEGADGAPEKPALLEDDPTEGEDKNVSGLIASADSNQYAVQVGAFLKRENAYRFAEKLKRQGYPAYVFHYTDSKGTDWNAVRAGDFPDPEAAKSAAVAFEKKENITAIVTRIDAISMVYVK